MLERTKMRKVRTVNRTVLSNESEVIQTSCALSSGAVMEVGSSR